MEKSQFDLFFKILNLFQKEEILDDLIIIGSWCLPIYDEYFKFPFLQTTLRTRDLDILVPAPSKFRREINLVGRFKEIGFETQFGAGTGYIRLMHPELIVEFLVPERGRGTDMPFPIRNLGINAQALRYLNLLTERPITVDYHRYKLKVPSPARFGLHKLIISQIRSKRDKADKDILAGVSVLTALIQIHKAGEISDVYHALPKKWQVKIIQSLEAIKELEILKVLRHKRRS